MLAHGLLVVPKLIILNFVKKHANQMYLIFSFEKIQPYSWRGEEENEA